MRFPQESFGQRSTVYPGRADLESIVAKELHPDGELQATVPSEATEYRSLGSAHQNQYTTRLGHRSIHRTTLDAEGTAFARMSAISEYSTDEFGIANQTNPPWDDETAPYGPVWEGKEKMRPVSDGRMIILGELIPIYLAWLMRIHSFDISRDAGCVTKSSTQTIEEQHGSCRSGLPAFQAKVKEQ